jgi:hypothetical protein
MREDSSWLAEIEINGQKFDIYGIYDEQSEDGIGFEYYDVYDSNGNCINEGDPFFDYPTVKEIEAML